MAKAIRATLTTTAQTFPPATIMPILYRFVLTSTGKPSVTKDSAYGVVPVVVQFDNVVAATYTVTVELLQPGGAKLGNTLTQTITVVPDDITIQVPGALALEVITV